MAFPQTPTQEVVEDVIANDLADSNSAMRAFMDARYYSVFNIKRGDTEAAIQTKINTAATVGQEVPVLFPRKGSFYCPTGLTIPSGIRLLGNDATVWTDQNNSIMTLAGDNISGEDLDYEGGMPDFSNGDATRANQLGVSYNGGTSAFTPLTKIKFRNCRFGHFYGIGAQIIHGRRIYFNHCEFDQYCRAGLWFTSVIVGDVGDCEFYGMDDLYLGTTFTYGFTATTQISTSGPNAGLLTDSINPRSQHIRVHDNYAERQAWECFDTHLGSNINFSDNESYGSGAIVAAVQNDNAISYSPLDIMIKGNNQSAYDITQISNGGIALVGSKDTSNPNRQLATGVISGNKISGGYTVDLSASGAINVQNTRGVPVTGNVLDRCKGKGFYLRNAYDTPLTGNSIIDLWGNTSPGPTAYYLLMDDVTQIMRIFSDNNMIVDGGLSKPFVNSLSYGGTANDHVQVFHQNDYNGNANPAGAASVQTHYFRSGFTSFANEITGFYGSAGISKPLSPGVATLSNVDTVVNNLLTDLRNMGLIN